MVILSKINGYRSGIINTIIDVLARQRPIPGPGLLASEGPGGTVLSLARRPAAAALEELPWTPRVYQKNDVWRIELRYCGYVRGPVTYLLGSSDDKKLDYPIEVENPNADSLYYVGIKIDTVSGREAISPEKALTISSHGPDVYDTHPPEDQYFRRLICTLRYSLDGEWYVAAAWHRLLPELGAYL